MAENETGRDIEWTPQMVKGAAPLYLAIADAIEADIRAGALRHGDRLPPQRALADRLGIDFTTVSRAYAEARRRALVEGRVGMGTFVQAPGAKSPPAASAPASAPASGIVDLTMNFPPRMADAALTSRLWAEVAGLENTGGMDLLLRYQEVGGTRADREAGVQWLGPCLPDLASDRLVITPGAQGALLALLTLLKHPDRPVAVEALCYPGFRSLAGHMGTGLVPVAMDGDGLIPEDLDAQCARHRPALLCCTPNLHNPTTATIPLDRREAIADIARKHDVIILEDDAYGRLAGNGLPPLAALAPERTYHIASLSKALAPALRMAYVVCPDARGAARLTGAVRATTSMASPLGAAIATRWIETGLAEQTLAAIRAETEARHALAHHLLGQDGLRGDPRAYHAWLPLDHGWSRGDFASRLRQAGISVVTSDAFAVGPAPEALRIGFAAPLERATLETGLREIADLACQSPTLANLIV
ncbi:DNA-binding transcriptional MocR family regulator [Novosphingobium sp. SG751A]|uniref:aminotransferase-like domain-containing protein n=1 Tax=Novosphingobium sp. SG751A TaxID=2587000 RepID=UPI0015519804|nr:PLP-dependent aminotransferase family protein [Novosphingobium sp. SG751A]NOW47736.1 DNA-binding transcriptional MocR family regulator [Novosphingobium sp. SG751A]